MTVRSRYAHRWLLATALTLTLTAGVAGGSGAARAQSLEQALAQAYANNPTIGAQRARLRAVDESVPQALSGYRPTARVTAGVTRSMGESKFDGGSAGSEANAKSVGITATQPIYDATVAPAVRRAERLVEAQRATLIASEQSVLLGAAQAYLDIVQNQAILQLQTNNEQVLRRQLEAARDRFRVGEYTRTDVSQSESRLSAALASRISAEGTLRASRATYERLVGAAPGELKAPKPAFRLPKNLDELVELARSNNPNVLSASYTEAAQREAVDQQYGRLLPSVGVSASGTRTFDPGRSSGVELNRSDSAQITAQVTIPLYQAGLPEAQVREAKQTANQARLQIEETRRQATEAAVSAWQSLQTARASIESYKAQIQAAQIALEGVRQEAQVGSRTVLDVLNQEQELLNARVFLVRAQHDEMVAAFNVLSASGQLTADRLNLPVQKYDPQANYEKTRGKWFGTSVTE
ncbi:TolC family outer membrane protein [Azospirillum picis]|uniref:Outer membrane protein/adhesin transport system outer membrane protein n=1 Tax=Azospirillum picis TaxID=488438 RepID=A0ABU0MGN3_9PROT|nr:TolC family outer membrane protein [Azospirillum picis]MBP2298335.1 outer membrane protein/adhesin transport system outer membrane protein [Azospirillum picis]MDQ0532616.1 outer membrane protein/adhesin transport system outer membrane protein [Azospirillum picis]